MLSLIHIWFTLHDCFISLGTSYNVIRLDSQDFLQNVCGTEPVSYTHLKGGLSFNLGDIIIPEEKEALVQKGYDEVEQVINNYNICLLYTS